MPVPKKPQRLVARVALTVQVPIDRGLEVDAIAQGMGISRHKLLRLAFNAGLPLVTDAAHLPPADPPQAA